MSASSYAQYISPTQTPQTEPVPGEQMVQNSAGGYSYEINKWSRLDRFLILGSDSNTYYATARKLTQENAACILECAAEDLSRTVAVIRVLSESGRAPKNDPAIFALALLASKPEFSARALLAVNPVCRTGTHFFQFLECVKHLRGRGRALKRTMQRWYTEKTPEHLAYQVTKYQSRENWSHRQALRLCRPKPPSPAHEAIFVHALGIPERAELFTQYEDPLLTAIRLVNRAQTSEDVTKLIREAQLTWEMVPTRFLKDPEVWSALLEKMPLMAMVRNLARMSSIGLTKPLSAVEATIQQRLLNPDTIKASRIHPISLLIAANTYMRGRGAKGSLSWEVNHTIVSSLLDSFYLAFPNVEPANKRTLLALDISGSMGQGEIAGSGLTPRQAAAAMATVTLRTEPQVHICAFCDKLVPVPLLKTDNFATAVGLCEQLSPRYGRTDCAQPMLYAMNHKLEVDTFVVYTDSETWFGSIHPMQALRQYREQTGIPAKLIVVGLTATDFTIADPKDRGTLDVVGFDAAAPALMADFAQNTL